MTEQERAAALADEIKRKNGLHFAANGYRLDGEDSAIVLSALRLLAVTPAASPVVTNEMVEAAVRAGMIDLSKSGPMPTLREQDRAMIEAALAAHHDTPAAADEVIERVAKAIVTPSSDIRSCDMFDAKRGVSALRPGDEIGDCVLVPKLPTEAMIMAWVGAGGGETVSPALRLGAMRDWSAMIAALAAAKTPE